jgi:hypothetical protein
MQILLHSIFCVATGSNTASPWVTLSSCVSTAFLESLAMRCALAKPLMMPSFCHTKKASHSLILHVCSFLFNIACRAAVASAGGTCLLPNMKQKRKQRRAAGSQLPDAEHKKLAKHKQLAWPLFPFCGNVNFPLASTP